MQRTINYISVRKSLKWRFKKHPHIQITEGKEIFNIKTGRQKKLTINGGSKGLWIDRKFVLLKDLNNHIELIPRMKTLTIILLLIQPDTSWIKENFNVFNSIIEKEENKVVITEKERSYHNRHSFYNLRIILEKDTIYFRDEKGLEIENQRTRQLRDSYLKNN